MLGYPLREISPAYAVTVREAFEISVGGVFARWNRASHTADWDDGRFIDLVAGQLAAVYLAGDETGNCMMRRLQQQLRLF